MNKSTFSKFMVKPILINVLLIWSCAGVIHADEQPSSYLSGQKRLLTDKQIRFLDKRVPKGLPKCSFLYSKSPVGSVTGDAIYYCIIGIDSWFWGTSVYKSLELSDPNSFNLLDAYLDEKLLPYVLAIPKKDQEMLLGQISRIVFLSLGFIKSMIDSGISPKKVLLRFAGQTSPWGSCEGYMLILDSNIGLYEDKKTLYEPVHVGETVSYSLYRWQDLFHLTYPHNNICPEVIERLVRASPELLNKRGEWYMMTPLNQFVRAPSEVPKRLQIIKMLTTPVNINLKDDFGNTPLHNFLENNALLNEYRRYDVVDKQIFQWLIEQGADINLKNNKGVSAKELILKRPDLSRLLK